MTADDPLHYHVGHPITAREAIDRVTRGLPAYLPTDPKPIDQTIYLRFAETRGPNSQ